MDKPKTQFVKIKDLKLLDRNPRRISKERFDILCDSIKNNPDYFWARPILANNATGENIVYAGNQRLKAGKKIGLKEVPCIIETLTDEQQKERMIRDNVELGEWDFDILSADFDISELTDMGVEVPNVDVEVLEAQEDDFEVPEESQIKTSIVQGDLIEIGRHRLMCGDSTIVTDVEKLMNGEKADICISDPPYGISVIEKNSRMKDLGWKQYKNDDNINTAVDAFNLANSICDKLVFWGANHYANKLPNVGGWLIWDKQDGKDSTTYSMGELAWSNILTNVQIFKHIWDGFRKDSEKGESRTHPSQKPVKLHEWILNKIECRIALDLFLGSGSTMVACHQLNRKCYGMELDPKYCQVIVDRMRKLDPTLEIKINGKLYDD